MKRKARFHKREIKSDRQGLFFYVGGSRPRPPKTTRFKEGQTVSVVFHKYNNDYWAFTDIDEYEIWRQE
jgi:hypothetical protein